MTCGYAHRVRGTRQAPERGLYSRASLAARRWSGRSQVVIVAVLVLCAALLVVGILRQPEWFPPSAFLLLIVVAVFLLRLRQLAVLGAVVMACTWGLWVWGAPTVIPGVLVVVTVAVIASIAFARGRERLGLQGAPGDLMLVDLRDRLAAHGRVPPLPAGWHVDSEFRSAHADGFSGDFMVAGSRSGSSALEIVLVDVSGKGLDAGVRSLQLSGAFGGLLGAMPREEFLGAANQYLLDQAWDEGFATAIHVAIDMTTGDFWVSSAGHPPAVQLHAGSGRLALLDTVGSPALGVVPDIRSEARAGRLDRGDVLMLYTDGVVEVRGGDLDQGIDRLMGVADRVLSPGRGSAAAVLAGVRAGDDDDRAVVLVRRD
ncbi:serine/threonine protein phosphatase [Cellulomonas sp. Root137]|nr:serine/threonine protein phosphatase [Cellulomonas sp. Root137]KRD41537.1 serine/threonine protein phosphatase [Cellulomonas sp. Root930]